MISRLGNILGRFTTNTVVTTARTVTTSSQLGFMVTQSLCAEPLKKKKKLDPSILRAREERRRKKIEKQIRRLEKNARQPKPIDECEVPLVLMTGGIKIHERKSAQISADSLDARVRLIKKWAMYRCSQSIEDIKIADSIIYAQAKALDELRQESEELYQEAIQIDPGFLPFSNKGPVVTPPIEGYDCPDGEYIDISRKWT